MIASMLAALLLMAQTAPEMSPWAARPTPLLTTRPSGRCISVPAQNGMTIVLERQDVDELVKPLPSDWTTEEERMRLVRSSQAQDLLSAVSDRRDALGCDIAGEIGFGAFVMIELVQAGRGRVWKAAASSFLPAVGVIGYESMDCSQPRPDYQLVEPGGDTFFSQVLCSVCTL